MFLLIHAEMLSADTGKNNYSELLETLTNVDVKLANVQADINSPLYSAKKFEDLNVYDVVTTTKKGGNF